MPIPLGFQSAQYTLISTNGTTTVNSSQAAAGPGSAGPGAAPPIYYGMQLVAAGTAAVATILDIVVSGTTTATNTIDIATGGTAGSAFPGGVLSVGVRCRGNLVIVTTGTAAGTWLTLWD
jgi:hypothetical protein